MEFQKEEGRIFHKDENGKTLAEITYSPGEEGVVVADGTYVDPSLRGQGVAEQLVEAMVEEVKRQGKKIQPECSYVVALFKRKPEKYGEIEAK